MRYVGLPEGRTWREHGVTSAAVLARNRHMAEGAPRLWQFAEDLIRDAVRKGYLAHDKGNQEAGSYALGATGLPVLFSAGLAAKNCQKGLPRWGR